MPWIEPELREKTESHVSVCASANGRRDTGRADRTAPQSLSLDIEVCVCSNRILSKEIRDRCDSFWRPSSPLGLKGYTSVALFWSSTYCRGTRPFSSTILRLRVQNKRTNEELEKAMENSLLYDSTVNDMIGSVSRMSSVTYV